jgi:hypothetical protein
MIISKKITDIKKRINPVIKVLKLVKFKALLIFNGDTIPPNVIETTDDTRKTRDNNIKMNHGFR